MKIRELLELTQTESLAEIAKNRLGIGKERAREALKKTGAYSKNGIRGWFYDGEESVLEQSIHDFVTPSKINRKPNPNVSTKRTNEQSNLVSNEHSTKGNEPTIERTNVTEQRGKEQIEQAENEVAPTKELTNVPTNERTKEGTKVTTNIIRKRSSFDIDVELMKDLKIQAIVHERNVYEIVETAVRQYLKELKK